MRRLIAAAMISLPSTATGQAVTGTVEDSLGKPLSGVLVVMLDAASVVGARALSDEHGGFTIKGPMPGMYRVRTTRIGFRPLLSEAFRLADGEVVTRTLILSIVPFALDTVHAQGKAACRIDRDSAMATWKLWEQIRAALTAGELTATSARLTATVFRYERTLDPIHRQVIRERTSVASDVIREPWKSRPVDSLRRAGYVADSNDFVVYNAPSLEMLASDAFLEDHCFRISVVNSELVGVAFEPIRERRKIPEVRGTVWMNAKTAALRRIDYRYTNVSKDIDAEAGGQMEFIQLRDGAWAIAKWAILMPRFSLFEGMFGFESKLVEYNVTGGELLAVTSAGTHDTLWSHQPVRLVGTVLDSVAARPVPAARVSLVGTNAMASTDEQGRFAIGGVIPGKYAVQVRTPSLDSVNAVNQASVTLTDSTPSITIRVPTGAQIATRLCGGSVVAPGILVGSVLFAGDSTPSSDATVTATWDVVASNASSATTHRRARGTKTDPRGGYTLCGLPVDADLTLEANAVDAAATTTIRIPAAKRTGRLDLTLEPRSAKPAAFEGIVLFDSTREPIPNVEVSFATLSRTATTNAKGKFRIDDLAPGVQHLRVRRLGYEQMDADINLESGRTLQDTVFLTRVTILDSVVVMSPMRDPGMDQFNEHRRLGQGHFLTRVDLAKFDMGHTAEAIAQIPGLQIVKGASDRAWVAGSRGAKSLHFFSVLPDDARLGARSDVCYGQVFVDNAQVYASSRSGKPEPLFDINSIPPSSIEAIEYYAGAAQVPAKYMRLNNECGVLVIHTRR